MPGKFNAVDADDGGWASTRNADKVAFSGANYAAQKPTVGGAAGSGVFGFSLCNGGIGVFGVNDSEAHLGVGVQGNGPEAGVSGYSGLGNGVRAFTHSWQHAAVFGSNDHVFNPDFWRGGPWGRPSFGPEFAAGVFGRTSFPAAAGVFGVNTGRGGSGVGVYGIGPSAGLQGFSSLGPGAIAQSQRGSGAVVTSEQGQALTAISFNDVGLFAEGPAFAGVFSGVVAITPVRNPVDTSAPINGSLVVTEGNVFLNAGSVFVTKGDVVLGNADCAEDFDLLAETIVEPGSVMVLDKSGALTECAVEYDKCAVGVVSGAGAYRPAIVLDRREHTSDRVPLALMGKVYCKVDADFGAVEVGDLLTTSSTRGHAMRATDCTRSFGAVIGKALQPHCSGRGLIKILVALQ